MDADARRLWKPLALLGAVGVLFVLAISLDAASWLDAARDWIGSLGAWGPAAYVGLYIVATVLMVPGTALTVVGGALFGAVWGVIYASIGATIGAAVAFVVARHVAAEQVRAWVQRRPAFKKLDAMSGRYGRWVVAITRLVPLFPFNVLNYALGLTRVGFWTYVVLTWLCILPGTIALVVGVDALMMAARQGTVPWPLVGAVVAAVIVSLGLGWWLKRRVLPADEPAADKS
jgi:uncharacterized membrane protein YdjX (TVP38/TMEM64 family)